MDGRYRLEALLHEGGQAYVWLGTDTVRDTRVAVKTLVYRATPRVGLPVGPRRLVREARILQAVGGSPYVMPLLDWGPSSVRAALYSDWAGPEDDGDFESADPWLVLPYLEHETLDAAVLGRPERSLGPDGTRVFAVDLARGLRHLHGHGVIHRDLSPGNVLLTDDGVVIADLGMAWAQRYADEVVDLPRSTGLTREAQRGITPGWHAPETVPDPGRPQRGRPDRAPSSDVFCWGLLVYAAYAGRHPWSSVGFSADAYEIGWMNKGSEPIELRTLPDPPLDRLVRAALSVDPADRPTAHELVDGIEAGSGSSGERLQSNSAGGVPHHAGRVAEQGRRRATRIRTGSLFAASAVVLLVVALVLLSVTGLPALRGTVTPSPTPVVTVAADGSLILARLEPFLERGSTIFDQSLTAAKPGWPRSDGTGPEATRMAFGHEGYALQPLSRDYLAMIPAPTDVLATDEVVTATAEMTPGQGYWGVWCRGGDDPTSKSYKFLISHTSTVGIQIGAEDPVWRHVDGIDLHKPVSLSGRCVDAPGAPVRLTLAVNGRTAMTVDTGTVSSAPLMGPGPAGIMVSPFRDVSSPLVRVTFTRFTLTDYAP